jgi:hypothetical protein
MMRSLIQPYKAVPSAREYTARTRRYTHSLAEPTSRAPLRSTGTRRSTSRRRLSRRSSRLSEAVSSSLLDARTSTEPPLHSRRCSDVVGTTTKGGPDTGEEVIEMSSDETRSLREGSFGVVHDERQEKQRQRQVLRIEGEDEEGDLARRIVLSIRVCAGESEGGQEGVCIQKVACENLEASQQQPPKLPPSPHHSSRNDESM